MLFFEVNLLTELLFIHAIDISVVSIMLRKF